MEHLLDGAVCKQEAERGEIGKGEGIEDRRVGSGGELHEIDTVMVLVEARRFGVHSDERLAAKRRDCFSKGLGTANVAIHTVSWRCGNL